MEHTRHKAVFLPGEVRVAGVRVRRVTLGHIRLLELADSPFLLGGDAAPDDCAIALVLLSRPWREGLRLLRSARRMAWRVTWMTALRRRVGDAGTFAALRALVDRVLWTPERFAGDGMPGHRPFALASGLSVRLAMRAARLPMAGLCHAGKGAWDCVWDVPADAVMLYAMADEESHGAQFMNAEEAVAEEGESGIWN